MAEGVGKAERCCTCRWYRPVVGEERKGMCALAVIRYPIPGQGRGARVTVADARSEYCGAWQARAAEPAP